MFGYRSRHAVLTDEGIAEFIEAFNYGLRNQKLLQDQGSGRIRARFYNCSLTSVFQPILHAVDDRLVGHHGLLRASGSDGASLSPWGMFSLAVADHELVDLDRLSRTLHVLNYYRRVQRAQALYLNVQLRLLLAVGRDFGRVFANRLERLGLEPGRICIVLPPDAVAHPGLLETVLLDYQGLGYRVVAQYPDDPAQWPHTRCGVPDILQFDLRTSTAPEAWHLTVKAAHGLGALALASRLEHRGLVASAREAGFDLLQGDQLGRPVEAGEVAPVPQRVHAMLSSPAFW